MGTNGSAGFQVIEFGATNTKCSACGKELLPGGGRNSWHDEVKKFVQEHAMCGFDKPMEKF